MTAPYNGAVVRGWLGSLSDAEIISKLADLETDPPEVEIAWDDVTDKPTEFPPADHSHTLSDISDAGGAAALDVGTGAGTVAAGDHNHEAADVTDLGDSALLNVGTSAGTVAAGDHTHANLVPTSRTVNGKALTGDVAVTGADAQLTGYTAGTAGAVAASDTVNAAIAKLEARLVALETV